MGTLGQLLTIRRVGVPLDLVYTWCKEKTFVLPFPTRKLTLDIHPAASHFMDWTLLVHSCNQYLFIFILNMYFCRLLYQIICRLLHYGHLLFIIILLHNHFHTTGCWNTNFDIYFQNVCHHLNLFSGVL